MRGRWPKAAVPDDTHRCVLTTFLTISNQFANQLFIFITPMRTGKFLALHLTTWISLLSLKNFKGRYVMVQKKCIPYGSDVSAGSFECADCGHIITVSSVTSLPPCNKKDCSRIQRCWHCLSGQGDAVENPYPEN